jgi:hypothetical protein
MPTVSFIFRCFLLSVALSPLVLAQDTPAPATAKVPLDRVIGTITAVDAASHTVTVQEDKTGTVHTLNLADTKTLLKVEPTAKDLKSAVRITAADLEVGDRVDARGTKLADTPTTINARSVILMSGRALEATHQEQSAAWAHATSGLVTAVDPATGKITADVRAAGVTQPVSVQTSATTEFSRYSPDSGKPAPSQISQIQIGDQLKVIGDKSGDGASITAQRVYSGAFRTIAATISAINPDGKSLTVKDLASKKEVNIALNADASIHKLPPMMAGFLARRLNPNAPAAPGAPNGGAAMADAGGTAGGGAPSPGGAPPAAGGLGAGRPGGGAGRGDVSQMIERLPKIALTDLKPGDALVISGVALTPDNSHLMANALIAGVEPVLQAAPQRASGRAGSAAGVSGDWGLGEMSAPQ